MLNETVSEYLRGANLSADDAKRLRALLVRLFGRGVLDMHTRLPLGRRIKTAVRSTFEQETIGQ